MKKIINGFVYDTEKAIEIGRATSGGSCRDFHYWRETLYKTPRVGRYFVAGQGGAMSHWSKPCGQDSWGGSCGIRPLSEKDALEWAAQYLDSETVESFFGDKLQEA